MTRTRSGIRTKADHTNWRDVHHERLAAAVHTRASAAQVNENAIFCRPVGPSPSTPTYAKILKLDQRKRVTRGSQQVIKPICLDFGLYRDDIYPNGEFCSHCKDYENTMLASGGTSRASIESKNFICQKPHKSWIYPFPYDPDEDDRVPARRSLKLGSASSKKFYADSETESAWESEYESDDDSYVSSDDDRAEGKSAGGGDKSSVAATVPPAVVSSPIVPSNTTGVPACEPDSKLPPTLAHNKKRNHEELEELQEQMQNFVHAKDQKIEELQRKVLLLSNKLTIQGNLHRNVRRKLSRRIANEAANEAKEALGQDADGSVTNKHESIVIPKSAAARKVAESIGTYLQQGNNDSTNNNARTTEKECDSFVRSLYDGHYQSRQELLSSIEKRAIKEYRQKTYSAPACSKEADMEGSTLNLKTFKVLRQMHSKNKRFDHSPVLPSDSAIQKVQMVVQQFGMDKIGMRQGMTARGGEFVEFDVERLLVEVFRSAQLTKVAKTRHIRIAVSIDGAQLTKGLTHVTMGFKINDIAAVCPFTKRAVFMNHDEQILQSRNLAIPVKIVLERETKNIYESFAKIFTLFHELSSKNEKGLPEDSLFHQLGFKGLNLSVNCDLSALWKIFGVGGAARVAQFCCTHCPVESMWLHVPNSELCNTWCQELKHADNNPNWKCYHHSIVTEEHLEQLRVEHEVAEGMISDSLPSLVDCLGEISAESQLDQVRNPRTPVGNSKSDPRSIHFQFEAPSVSETDRASFSERVTNDLDVRGLDITGTLEERSNRLRDHMISEYSLRQIKKGLEHGEKLKKGAVFMILDAIPCILHMENRMGLKILTLLFTEGLANSQDGMYPNIQGEKKCREHFLSTLEQYANTRTMGQVDNRSQWSCPTEEGTKKIGTLCLDNNRTRKMVQNISGLIDICIPPGSERSEKWKSCMAKYIPSWEQTRRKEPFSKSEVLQWQKDVDLCYQEWVAMHSSEGMTNYWHIWGSGHLAEYLLQWGSLYPFSQQGWEALNSMIKCYYFRRTQQGGLKGGKRASVKRKSHVEAIGLWFMRRSVWALGLPYDEMKDAVSVDFNKGFKIPGVSDVSFSQDRINLEAHVGSATGN
jgi:hypothetical protein